MVKSSYARRLRAELLEDRRMLAAVAVNTVLDAEDGDTTSIASLISSPGADNVISLREAITAANNTAGADTITFDSTVFTGGLNSLIRLGGTELEITESLTIDGSNATNVVISGDALGNDTPVAGSFITDVAASDAAGRLGDNSRVLNFSAASGDLTLNRLTITGGRTVGNVEGSGGGIAAAYGTVMLNGSTVSGNSTTGSNANGGGIFSFSSAVTLTGSTVSRNTAADNGGGIASVSGAVTLNSSTVSGNSTGPGGDGGGILAAYGPVTLTSSTVANNSSGGRGGGVFVFDTGNNPLLTIQNSIVAGNTAAFEAPDLRPDPGLAIDIDFSLIGDTTDSFVSAGLGTGNVLDVDPLLGPTG